MDIREVLSKYKITDKQDYLKKRLIDISYNWQQIFLNDLRDSQIFFSIKGRVNGYSVLNATIAFIYLVDDYSHNMIYLTPSPSYTFNDSIRYNVSQNFDVHLVENSKYVALTRDSKITQDTFKNFHIRSKDRYDIIFIDEFLFIDNFNRQKLELIIDYILQDPRRKLFIGGTIDSEKSTLKFIKHINNIPTDMKKYIIKNTDNDQSRIGIDLYNNLKGVERNPIIEHRPDLFLDFLKPEYSDDFKVI